MTESNAPRPISLGVKIGFLLLVAGLAAWIWLGDWRWAVMGALALLAGAVVGAPQASRRS